MKTTFPHSGSSGLEKLLSNIYGIVIYSLIKEYAIYNI